jgi:hypothetical protein
MAERDSSGGRDTDTGEAVFYYSREHRLKRASPAVRALYEDASRPDIVKNLAGRKSNLFLLVAILMVCVMMILGSRVPGGGKGVQLGGNTVALAIARNKDGTLSMFMQKKAASSGSAYTGEAAVAVSPALSKQDKGKTPEIYADKFFFSSAGEESFRFDLPFEGETFLVILQAGNERKTLRLKVKEIRD